MSAPARRRSRKHHLAPADLLKDKPPVWSGIADTRLIPLSVADIAPMEERARERTHELRATHFPSPNRKSVGNRFGIRLTRQQIGRTG